MRRSLGPISLLLLLVVLASCSGGGRPTGTIAFAANGSIYLLDLPDGEPRVVIDGDRGDASRWASAPALSPDGTRIAFARDGDLWIADSDGEHERRIVDRDTEPPTTGASHFTLGAQTAAWSDDGTRIVYVVARIGGSGLAELWMTELQGSEHRMIDWDGIGVTVEAAWTAEGDPTFAAVASGPGRTGTDAVTSPTGAWVAYVAGEQMIVATVDGEVARRVELGALGGRDHHLVEGCAGSACSYRRPALSWVQ